MKKTIQNLNKNDGKISIKIIYKICKEFNYSPTFVLLGEVNSNSKCDQYYEMLDEKGKRRIINIVKALTNLNMNG